MLEKHLTKFNIHYDEMLRKLGVEGNVLNLIKNTGEKPTVKFILFFFSAVSSLKSSSLFLN